jgi:hypothetical protein
MVYVCSLLVGCAGVLAALTRANCRHRSGLKVLLSVMCNNGTDCCATNSLDGFGLVPCRGMNGMNAPWVLHACMC